jgi:hypothetical protein
MSSMVSFTSFISSKQFISAPREREEGGANRDERLIRYTRA